MKKFSNFMFSICLVILITISVVGKPLSNLEEIWNFNIARGISNGLVPYRDMNMVSTPLFYFILAIPLKIFGQELFYTRVCAIIMALYLFILIFKIMKNMDIKREISNLITILIVGIVGEFVTIKNDFFVLILILQIILFEIKMEKSRKWDKLYIDIIIGLLAGFIVCSKQSVGLLMCIFVAANPLFSIEGKNDFIVKLRKSLFRLIGILLPIIILLIYLKQNGALDLFIDYTLYNINNISRYVGYDYFFMNTNTLYKVLAIVVPTTIILTLLIDIILKFKKRYNHMFFYMSVYCMGMFFVVFPVTDIEHFSLAIVPSIVLIVGIFKTAICNTKFIKDINYKYVLEFINVCAMLLILSGTLLLEYKKSESMGIVSKYDYQRHFRYINIDDELNKSITIINEFEDVKEKKLYIVDPIAAVYMIPKDRYNKNFDMLCVGSFGSGGEASVIENIKNEDALYLIVKDEKNCNCQNIDQIRSYIKENMEFIGTKSYFEIYQNKTVIEEKNEIE